MLSFLKRIIVKLIPPFFGDLFLFFRRRFVNFFAERNDGSLKFGFNGIFENWNDAAKICGSYNSEEILKKCTESMLKIKSGEALYERDSVIFDEIQYSWPLVAGLLYSALNSRGVLNVLDFGGSLGSSFFQNKNFLTGLNKLKWNVVEQPSFVKSGNSLFKDDTLSFYDSIDSCVGDHGEVNVFLASSSLPYIQDPFALIKKILTYKFPYIIIDRTYFIDLPKSIVTAQRVPPNIYDASYPAWFFNYEEFISFFASQYRIVATFESYLQATNILEGIRTREMGIIFELNEISLHSI
ncbi:methyltransferase, TIGR04325 family [Leptospira kmetyi]|uniref:Methyltransferase, TIGR04325 family n=1 Tax=Leptospira kmetyi TaxID=408139 RepID=A0AAD0UVV9_9LEPT|nr:TIGR04325 family methyltransferase [Leptospira kmetyi]AYV57238.1 methyltransferase, TIGR04325 family [Leptospira kmetyi]